MAGFLFTLLSQKAKRNSGFIFTKLLINKFMCLRIKTPKIEFPETIKLNIQIMDNFVFN